MKEKITTANLIQAEKTLRENGAVPLDEMEFGIIFPDGFTGDGDEEGVLVCRRVGETEWKPV